MAVTNLGTSDARLGRRLKLGQAIGTGCGELLHTATSTISPTQTADQELVAAANSRKRLVLWDWGPRWVYPR